MAVFSRYRDVMVTDVPIGFITFPTDQHLAVDGPQMVDRHFVLGQRSRFVRADDIGTT